jgi:hypothetical protein
MAQPTLGEAIALQGRIGVAEQLGATKLKMAEAEKNRNFRLAYQEGAQKKKDQKEADVQFAKLFSDKANFHRLVSGEKDKVLNEAFEEYSKVKSSGNPYAANEFNQIIFNTSQKIAQLRTLSENYKQFEKQAIAAEKGNGFVNPKDREFINLFSKAGSREELRNKLTEQGFEFGDDLVFNEDDQIVYSPKRKINYDRDLSAKISQMKKIPFGENQKALPFENIQLTKYSAVPYKIEDAEKMYKDNPKMFPSGIPTSIEEVVNTYVNNNVGVIEQFAANANIPLRVNENGTYDVEDLKKVKDGLMENMRQYSNVFVNDKIIKPGTKITVNTAEGAEALDDASISDSVEDMNYIQGDKLVKKQVTRRGIKQINLDFGNISKSPEVFDASNKQVSGDLKNTKLSSIKIYPAKIVDKQFRIAYDGEKPQSYQLFYEIESGSEKYFIPFDKISFTEKISGTDKYKISLQLGIMKLIEAKNKLDATLK